VSPLPLGDGEESRHEIIFVSRYSNYIINSGDRIFIEYERGNGGASSFNLTGLTDAYSTSSWGATFNAPNVSGQDINMDINAGTTAPAIPENIILTVLTNDADSTNRILFIIAQGTGGSGQTNEYPEYSNDFRVYTPDDFFVNDNSTSGDIYTYNIGNDTTGNGTRQKPFRTMSKVVNTYNLSGGKQLWVDNGTYTENVYVSASDSGTIGNYLEFIGAGTNSGSTSLVSGSDGSYTFQFRDTKWIRILGFDIIEATNGISLEKSTNLRIESCNMFSNGYGIKLYASPSNTIINNVFAYNTNYNAYPAGIYFGLSANGNTIVDNIFRNERKGVETGFEMTRGNIFTNNIFRLCYKGGIKLQYSKNHRVVNNQFYQCHPVNLTNWDGDIYLTAMAVSNYIADNSFVTNWIGIRVDDGTNNSIINNVIGTNDESGIWLEGRCIANLIRDNTVHNARYNGIKLYQVTSSNMIMSNNCYYNNNGMEIIRSTNIYIINNFTETNHDKGIFMLDCNLFRVEGNLCYNNYNAGIYMQDECSYNIIRQNECTRAGWAGIIIQGYNNRIYTNYCYKNWGNGIKVEDNGSDDTKGNVLTGNQCYTNNNMGIYLYGSRVSTSTLINNTCFSNPTGIFIEDGGHNYVNNNTAYNNFDPTWGGGGIFIKYSGTNQVGDNRLTGNSQAGNGIYVESSWDNVLINNFISDHDYGIFIYHSTNNQIQDNVSATNADYGIYFTNSSSNMIHNNDCFSNANRGIYLRLYCNNNSLSNNTVYRSGYDGIKIEQSSDNRITDNTVYNSALSGIAVTLPSSVNNYIHGNSTYQNQNGIWLEGVSDNTIFSNYAYENSQSGLNLTGSTNTMIRGNFFNRNTSQNGMIADSISVHNRIIDNYCLSNIGVGIRINNNSDNNYCASNISAFNTHGIRLNNSSTATLYANAVYHNNGHGIWCSGSDNNIIYHNSVASNSAVGGGNDNLKFEADSSGSLVKNNIFAFAKTAIAYGINDLGGNIFAYNDVYGNVSGDYQNCADSGGGIQQDPKWISYDLFSTNFLFLSDSSLCIDAGTNLGYSFTGSDPDMGWKEFDRAYIRITLSKSVSNVTQSGTASSAIPGSSVLYKVEFQITGTMSATNIVIYDMIPVYSLYWTNYLGTATAWTSQYATNDPPDQSYPSTDYKTSFTARSNVMWIRWKKPDQAAGTTGTLFYKVIIK